MSHSTKPNLVQTNRDCWRSHSLLHCYFRFLAVIALIFPAFAFAQTTLNSGATINITMNQGQSFSQSFVGTGTFDNSYTLNGATPPGISVATVSAPPPATFGHNMVLSGTPTSSGVYTFNIDVVASFFSSASNYSTTLVVTVLPPAPTANNSNQTVLSNSTSNVLTPSTSGSVTSISIQAAPTHGNAVVSGTTIVYTPFASYSGADSISFQATGPGGTSGTATISITVQAPAPTISNASATVAINSSNNVISPTISGSATSINVISTPSHGSATTSGLNVLYTPSAGYSGSDSFLVTASGPGGTSSSATISVTITPSAPTVSAISTTVAANSSNNTLTPTITGSATSLTVTAAPAHGSASVSGLTILYTPSAGYSGNDSFSFTATGPGGTSTAATATITITPPAPTIAATSATVAANSSNNVISPVITGSVSSVAIASAPAHGSASVSGRTFLYTPNAGYSGSDSFTVNATGPGGTSAPATVSITVTPPAPTVTASSATVAANSTNNTITPTISGSVTSITIVTAPLHGSAVVSGLSVRYSPSPGYSGPDNFSITATGPGGTSAAADINITVTPPPPSVASTSATVAANSTNNTIVPSITGTASNLSIVSAPLHGSATLSGLNVLYTPNAGYSGTDSLAITAAGPGGTSSSATINLTVTPPAPAITGNSTTVAANSTNNAITPTITGSVTSIALSTTPAHGSASVSGLTVLYTPNSGYSGNDNFSVIATGPGGSSSAANFSIVITPPAPTVSGSSVTVSANSSNNSIAPTITGSATSLTLVSTPSHGSASVSGLTLQYTPSAGYSGSDSITFTANGPGGTSAVATINITVVAVAVPPSLTNGNLTVASSSTNNSYSPTITGSASALTIVSAPANGSAVVSGLNILYTPNSGFSGSDSLSISASGPGGTSNTATINVTVTPPAPTVSASSVNIAANSPGNSITPSVSGSVSNIVLNTLPAHGTANINGMSVFYVPTTGYAGSDSFSFSAVGPGGTSGTATVSINVIASAPVLSGNEFIVAGNSNNNVLSPTINGITTSIALTTNPTHGTANVSGLSVIYTPTKDYTGTDSMTIVATGPGGASAPLLVNITVEDLAPTTSNSTATVVSNSKDNALTPSIRGSVSDIFITAPASHGSASVVGSNIVYTPNAGYIGTDAISFVAAGRGGNSSPATISINVISQVPSASNSSVNVSANSSSNLITPMTSGNVTSVAITTASTHGTVTIDGLKFNYTPNPGYIGPDAISFIANGPGGSSASALISINVVPSDQTTPIVKDLDITVPANSTLNPIAPQISGNVNSIAITAAPLHGTLNTSGLQITYTPSKDFIGNDEFSMTASGSGGTSAPAKIRITVIAGAPKIESSNLIVPLNSTRSVTPVITGIANGLSITSAPAHGKAVVNGLSVSYTPDTNYVGEDSLNLIATGPSGNSAPATIAISVTPNLPSVSSSSVSVAANSSGNVITPRITGNATSLSIVKTTAHGVISVNGLALSYTPVVGYIGPDAVSVIAIGKDGNSLPAEISIEVTPLQASSLDVTVQTNSANNLITTGKIAGSSAATLAVQPSHGTATIEGFDVRYTPSSNYLGNDSLKVQINGGNGMLTSIDVNITVAATAPTVTRARLSVESGRTASIDLASVISGPQYNGYTLAVSQVPNHGVVSISGTKLSFTANANYVGNDSLLFTVSSLGGVSKPAQLDITITARPDPTIDRGVQSIQNATTAMVRHFEQVQIDQFNGRLLELASKDTSTDKGEADRKSVV